MVIGEWPLFAAGGVCGACAFVGAPSRGEAWGLGLILLERRYSSRGAAPTGAVVSLGEVNNLGRIPW